jgi:hypothetical protein
VSAAISAQKAKATNLPGWLLAKDKYEHRHAYARRLGIMYIVWNRRIWGAWGPAGRPTA